MEPCRSPTSNPLKPLGLQILLLVALLSARASECSHKAKSPPPPPASTTPKTPPSSAPTPPPPHHKKSPHPPPPPSSTTPKTPPSPTPTPPLRSPLPPAVGTVQYKALTCRGFTASITDYGGVGDGVTLNTKAFRDAVNDLSKYAAKGGAQLVVPAGKWLTGSFNLTSHFTLFLHKDAVILASQNFGDYPTIAALPSYGRGRDTKSASTLRYGSLILGQNVTDVVITGQNGTIDGQGQVWWKKWKSLKYNRPYLVEVISSTDVQISNLTFINSPSWNIHPVYSKNVIITYVTILAPVRSPNTDGINPDSSDNVKIEDCYVVSGDDCVAVKSGWDEYGIAYGMPSQNIIVRRLTCVSPYSATIALGSEMSGGIRNVRAEQVTAVETESALRVKTAVGRGAFVEDIYARNFTLHTMKYFLWMGGNYSAHPDARYNRSAYPVVNNLNFRDATAYDVTMAGRLQGIAGHPFTGICLSNVMVEMRKARKYSWVCGDISGSSTGVTPEPCRELQGPSKANDCDFPADPIPIDAVKLQTCYIGGKKT